MPVRVVESTGDEVFPARPLWGDDKIQVAVVEGRRLLRRADELLTTIKRARFVDDPPNNQVVRDARSELARVVDDLRNVTEDLRLFTEVQPDHRRL